MKKKSPKSRAKKKKVGAIVGREMGAALLASSSKPWSAEALLRRQIAELETDTSMEPWRKHVAMKRYVESLARLEQMAPITEKRLANSAAFARFTKNLVSVVAPYGPDISRAVGNELAELERRAAAAHE